MITICHLQRNLHAGTAEKKVVASLVDILSVFLSGTAKGNLKPVLFTVEDDRWAIMTTDNCRADSCWNFN